MATDTNANLAARLIQRAAHQPERAAIVQYRGGQAQQTTFGQLAADAAAMAATLRARGVRPGDRVLIFVPMSTTLYVWLLSCLHAGATAVFVDAWADRRRLGEAVAAVQPRAFIGSLKAHVLRLLVPAVRRIPIKIVAVSGAPAGMRPRRVSDRARSGNADDLPSTARASGLPAPTHRNADDPALITFTTGSTGRPKAAVRSHAFLWAQHLALASHLGLRDDDIDMPTLPIFVLNNLALGVTSVIPDFDPRRPADIKADVVWSQIVAARVTTTTGSPAFYDRLLEYGAAHGAKLPVRALFTGGAPVLPPLARRLRDGVVGAAHVVYGSTEAEPISGIGVDELVRLDEEERAGVSDRVSREVSAGLGAAARGGGADDRVSDGVTERAGEHVRVGRRGVARGGICVGVPVRGIELRVLVPTDGPIDAAQLGTLEAPAGESGEIVVAGAHVLRGYLNDPEAERQAKIRDGERVWHRTGDGGRLDASGRLWLMGRVRERVRRGGEVWWGLPAEVRALRHPAVRHAAYLGVDDSPLAQRAVLVVEADALAEAQREEVVRLVAPHPVDELRVLDRIPRDPRHASKTDTEVLRRLLQR